MEYPQENARLARVYEAASRLFIRRGYKDTQMSHIAAAVGVSVGTLYLDFAGKGEIKDFILQCTIDPGFMQRTFTRPITSELFQGLEAGLTATLEGVSAEFAGRLENPETYSMEALLSDSFDLLSRYAVGCMFIERNGGDFPALADSYAAYRAGFFATMQGYLKAFIRLGTIRPLPYPAHTATLIIETLTWWAMDVHYRSYETMDIDPALAKAVVLDTLLPAYGI